MQPTSVNPWLFVYIRQVLLPFVRCAHAKYTKIILCNVSSALLTFSNGNDDDDRMNEMCASYYTVHTHTHRIT